MLVIAINWPTEWSEILIIGTHVALASVVTSHALLTKSNVRAALGWIALAWLSPFFGVLLYYFFGINRVTRRALRLSKLEQWHRHITGPGAEPIVSENIADLDTISERVTGNPLIADNAISILRGGDEAYAVMLPAIANARRSIALASYIFRNDAIGNGFVEALIAARRRGVAVRVLLDGIGSGYFYSGILRRLRAAEIPVARFLHTWAPWRMAALNMRNHKKLLIVDGALGFTGGLNIGAENSARFSPKKYVDDVHARVEGPVTAQLMDAFARDWSFTTGEVLDDELWWPAPKAAGTVYARGIQSGPDEDIYSLETILAAALVQARERVRIVTPYFLPDQRLQFAIAQATMRGISIDLVIPEHCDHVFMDWAMRAHFRFFGETSANIYIDPSPFDHAKLVTVDGEWCVVGSSNWDTRSLRLNFEFDLECYGRTVAADIDTLIDQKIGRSYRLCHHDLASKPRWVRIRDAAVRLLLPYL